MRLTSIITTSFLIIFSFWSISAQAVPVPDLYTAQVPASTNADQTLLLEQALAQVLAKVSADPDVTKNPAIQKNLDKAPKMVLSYRYIHEQSVEPNPESRPEQDLQARFSQDMVDSLLHHAGYQAWGEDRPLITVWLAVASPNKGKQLINDESEPKLANIIHHDANQTGLPVLLPLYDLSDMSNMRAEDIWAPFPWVIEKAAKRYHSDSTLIGKVYAPGFASNKQWVAQWTLVDGGKENTWHSDADSFDELVQNNFTSLAQKLAPKYLANKTAAPHQLTVTVYGVSGLAGYTHVAQYLQKMAPVQSVEVADINPDYVIFDVNIIGNQAHLAKSIELDHYLVPMENTPNGGLNYRLRG